jgi:hypothetical protein
MNKSVQVKPLRLLLLLFYLLLIQIALEFLPNEIDWLGDGIKIKIPKISALWNKPQEDYADISKIREQFEDKKGEKGNKKDSTTNEQAYSENFLPDSLRINHKLRIQYPKGDSTILNDFFETLHYLEKNKGKDTLVRVLHFGDSQLEGDRITTNLRDRFQDQFGGCGTGILNIVDKMNSKLSIVQNTKSYWQNSGAYGIKYNRSLPNYFGVTGECYKLAPAENIKGEVTYIKSAHAKPKEQRVERIKLMYRNPDSPIEVSLKIPSLPDEKITLEKSDKPQVLDYELKNPFQQVTIQLDAKDKSPEIYGVALDCKKGIAFDNIPWRGSSGVEFTNMNRENFKRQLKQLHVKFIILQFGVNIVPSPVEDYTFYKNMLLQQLKMLKEIAPEVSILVIGVSDMSWNRRGVYESYPNIEKIRDAQRKAAFESGCAFWDLYEAMGGKNSMPSWVFAKPIPLAGKDFTHFTPEGAKIVSEMLYKALLVEYAKYLEFNTF